MTKLNKSETKGDVKDDRKGDSSTEKVSKDSINHDDEPLKKEGSGESVFRVLGQIRFYQVLLKFLLAIVFFVSLGSNLNESADVHTNKRTVSQDNSKYEQQSYDRQHNTHNTHTHPRTSGVYEHMHTHPKDMAHQEMSGGYAEEYDEDEVFEDYEMSQEYAQREKIERMSSRSSSSARGKRGNDEQGGEQQPMLVKTGTLKATAAFTNDRDNPLLGIISNQKHVSFASMKMKFKSVLASYDGSYLEKEDYSTTPHHYLTGEYGARTHNTVNLDRWSVVARVPSDKFDEFMEEIVVFSSLKHTGIEVESVTADVKDVTSSYVDTASRVAVLESSEAALRKLMGDATKIKDVIEVERELRKVIQEKESAVKKKTTLQNSASYSTLRLTLSERPPNFAPLPGPPPPLQKFWSPLKTFKKASEKLIKHTQSVLDTLIYNSVLWSPFILVFSVAMYFIFCCSNFFSFNEKTNSCGGGVPIIQDI